MKYTQVILVSELAFTEIINVGNWGLKWVCFHLSNLRTDVTRPKRISKQHSQILLVK
jgi:hypothetical protein